MTGNGNNKLYCMGEDLLLKQHEDNHSDSLKIKGNDEKHMVHWFRKGLRLDDNPSLRDGLDGASTYRCIFILDPWFAGSTNVSINKWR